MVYANSIGLGAILGAGIGSALGAGVGYLYQKHKMSAPRVPALSKDYQEFTVLSNEPVNYNTHRITFSLPKNTNILGLPIASCLMARFKDIAGSGKMIARPYTPTTSNDESLTSGKFELLVKKYPGGFMSTHICELKPGQSLEMAGPYEKIDMAKDTRSNIGMLAGGTGITPMYQVMSYVLKNPQDRRKIKLVFGNVEEADILLRSEIEALKKAHPNRLDVLYTLDRPPSTGWTHESGYITKDMITKFLPPPNDPSTLILVCGPDPMVAKLAGLKNPDYSQGPLNGLLKDLGYTSENVYKF